MAKACHEASRRNEEAFLALNCASLPDSVAEAELFGSAPEVSGQAESKVGLLERAKGGTLFLDEVGDMSAQLQVKLLRVLQEGSYRRIGDDHELQFDVRIICTTQKDLGKLSSVSRILGSKGLMPSLKNGTITQNFSQTILKFSDDKINYKVDKYGIIHLIFGKINFTEKKLNDNLSYIINHLNNSKPNNIKGKFIKNVHICTTMSPSIKISNY